MHLFTSSIMKLFVSSAFLKSLMKIGSRNGSIYFLKVSHSSARVIIPFLAKLDLKDGAGVDAEGMADLLREGELALAGDGGFHFLTPV